MIGRAAEGDAAAREIFATTYLPVLRGFLEGRWRNTPWYEQVDDALQEVFVELLRDDGALTKARAARGELGGFLFGVTRNVALRIEERAAKRRLRNQEVGSAIELIQSRETTLSVMFDRGWAQTLVRLAGERMRRAAAMGSDGARLRAELLRLRFGEGKPIREIAALWDAEPRKVHKAYEKARAEFRRFLEHVMAEHGALPDSNQDSAVDRLLDLL